MMTEDQLRAEVEKRGAINEGRKMWVYDDATGAPPVTPGVFVGNPTVGIGCNMASCGRELFESIGVNYYDVLNGRVALTGEQIDAIYKKQIYDAIASFRASLAPGIYDSMADARKGAGIDIEFNVGQDGWLGFAASRALWNEAQTAKNRGDGVKAHILFGLVADHLRASAYDGQVGNRARRNEAMIRSSRWCDPNGDGSDVL